MTADVALASLVAVSPPSSWGSTCPAWIESAERRCGKPRQEGLLCSRHASMAWRRLAADEARRKSEQAKAAAQRASSLPRWRSELEKVDAELERLNPASPTADLAAFTGAVHSRIDRGRRVSESKVERLAALWKKRIRLANLIGDDQ